MVSIEGSRLESGIKAQVSMTQDSGSLLYPFLKHFNACFFLASSMRLVFSVGKMSGPCQIIIHEP